PLNGQRVIHVHSNDPETPKMQLTIQLDYTPLYEVTPKLLRMNVPAGKDEAQGGFNISRNDGQPLGIERLTASPEWISAAFDPAFKGEEGAARVKVTVRRPAGPPGPVAGKVQMWMTNQTARPVQSIAVAAEIQGELAAIPPRLYWVVPDFGTNMAAYPAESLTRTIELISVLGHEMELKKASSDVKG